MSKEEPSPQEEVEAAIESENAGDMQAEEAGETKVVDGPVQHSGQDVPIPPQGAEVADQPTVTEKISDAVENASSSAYAAAAGAASSAAGAAGYRPQDRRPSSYDRIEQVNEPKRTLYVGNLFFDVTENDLTKEFSRFGTLKGVRLLRDSRGLSKGSVSRGTYKHVS